MTDVVFDTNPEYVIASRVLRNESGITVCDVCVNVVKEDNGTNIYVCKKKTKNIMQSYNQDQ